MIPGRRDLALLADLYEFTMAAAYYEHGMFGPSVFSLFVREVPANRGYLVHAGLEEALDLLEGFRLRPEDLEYLASLELFRDEFLHYLSSLRFTGDVAALAEGRLFFPGEPVLEITAPLIEGQLVETAVSNCVNLQTTLASKAARCVWAAGGRRLIDFSLRRTQGVSAGLGAARSSYLAGFDATSNLLAGRRFGIPVAGTMAHSFVTCFPDELTAFRAFADTFPDKTSLLLDTYETLGAARKAVQVGRELAEEGAALQGVRLDSGDLAALSREVRRILDEAGLPDVKILGSGGLDEFEIADLLARGGEFDGFGVGTKMGTSADAPYADLAYKLVEYEGRPTLKLSSRKETLAGPKQVFRRCEGGELAGDTIGRRGEVLPGEALLQPVLQGGARIKPAEPLAAARERFREEFARLGAGHKDLVNPTVYPVERSQELRELQEKVTAQVRARELAAG